MMQKMLSEKPLLLLKPKAWGSRIQGAKGSSDRPLVLRFSIYHLKPRTNYRLFFSLESLLERSVNPPLVGILESLNPLRRI
jgi:hypothetical protein